ncbi:trypsin-like peptidase domain-containing protein [Clostridium bornimense]|uniref:S1C family serine protease n=1 Tax=Clostridium bornimense TaxID=1216932 RepID=UPI001C12275D|nr:trypsin-like peptidase domain-containing protein [Clostridium bornimense]MBU5316761.1 trypsin-like peptidase domain-containing protein [Clostridium bornimense]
MNEFNNFQDDNNNTTSSTNNNNSSNDIENTVSMDSNNINFTMKNDDSDSAQDVKFEDVYTNNSNNHNKKVKTKKMKKGLGKTIALCVLISAVVGTGSGITSSLITNKLTASNKSNNVKTVTNTEQLSFSTTGGVSIPDIYNKVSPAVVGITTQNLTLNQFQVQGGSGSGFIFSKEGYVLTNYHVIEGASKISVMFSNKTTADATVVNYDEDLDVAVLKISGNMEMPAVLELDSSADVLVGEPVIAIGSPLGETFLNSLTSGIVSAKDRRIEDTDTVKTYIQTDAAINPGNSGGPLINAYGKVIGINTAKISDSSVSGMGFAIPITAVADTVKDLVDNPLNTSITLGVSIQNLSDTELKYYQLDHGVRVASVSAGSIAANGGIEPNDIITKFNGKDISSTSDLQKAKGKVSSGDKVEVDINRLGKTMTVTLNIQ